MGKTETAAALPHCCECVFCVSLRCWPSSNFSHFCANMFVLSTEIAVQKCRANYFELKLRAATRTTLILQPAIDSSNMVYGAYDVQCRLVLATPPCISNP
jgi:hypothetical protein